MGSCADTVALVVLGVALLPSQEWRLTLEFVSRAVGNSLFILACSVVGLLIVSHRPGNVVGWIYALVPRTRPRCGGQGRRRWCS
jgi:hypothetical protein